MINLIIHFALLGLAVYGIAQFLPGVKMNGYGAAVSVAVVYGIVNVTLGVFIKFLSLPFIFLTGGLMILVINTVLLRITDKILDNFEIDSWANTFIAAILITVADTFLSYLF